MMQIFFYTRNPRRFATEITCTLALSAEKSFQFYSVYNQNKFAQLLHDGLGRESVVIAAAPTGEDLNSFSLLREKYHNLRFILLLENYTDKILQMSQKLRPEFMTTVQHDFRYVLSVAELLGKTAPSKKKSEKEKKLTCRAGRKGVPLKACNNF